MRIRIALLGAALSSAAVLSAQNQAVFTGSVVTGQLQLLRTTNLSSFTLAGTFRAAPLGATTPATPEKPRLQPRLPPPPVVPKSVSLSANEHLASALASPGLSPANASSAQALIQSLAASPAAGGTGFNGMTHSDQRLANSGNQFSLEPPNPSIAVANGYVLEGVNNAVRVFSTSGAQLIPTISANQLFGLGPAIDRTRTPNVYGVFTTDMRVFYDQDTSRWFVLQRSQDEDTAGNPI